MKAVIYAAKSTEDKHGSIPTQIEDCKVLAEREGWEIVGEFKDEGFSAYSGNRGPDLERAKGLAVATAAEHGRCILVAQDTDRFARGAGDKPGAADHLGEVYFAMKRQSVDLWSIRTGRIDGIRAVIEGERSHDESARKTQDVTDGLRRRKESGKPVGPIPLGYIVEKKVIEEKVFTSRVIDPATRTTVERIFDLVEKNGFTFGDVARTLNAEGITTRRGNAWVGRTIRKIVHNRAYAGEKGYPEIIDPDRFEEIHANLARLDPVQVSKRRGGRKPDPAFILRGIARCQRCGASLYTRTERGRRVYVCRHRRDGTRLCQAPVIEAELIEDHVLRHLECFAGSIETWIASMLVDRDSDRQAREAALDRARVHLTGLDSKRERHLDEYRRQVEEGATTAGIALEEVERIDRQRGEQERLIAETEALVSEWSGPPDMDSALDFYNEIICMVRGVIEQAEGSAELRLALQQVLSGLWAEIEEDRLLVEFELVGHPEANQRPTLPPRPVDDRLWPEFPDKLLSHPLDPESVRQTGTHTLVWVQPQSEQISALGLTHWEPALPRALQSKPATARCPRRGEIRAPADDKGARCLSA